MNKIKILLIFLCINFISCSQASNSSNITWEECGGNVGDHACDFYLMDQTGNDWSLYDNYGSIIILDFSAMWCGYCQKAAKVAQIIQDEYKDDNVIWVTILLQNNYGQIPMLNDLLEWEKVFEMTSSPILSGNTGIIDKTAQNGFNIRSWPGFVIIDRDMIIAYELFGWNEMQITLWLDQLVKKDNLDNRLE